ncbi:MAG: ABC transporter permease [Limnothrix sp. BL-A-16]|jgi:putative ABC transport system permease protein
MNLWESLKMAIATLAANKLRSSLTMLGIVIGNASVIATIGVGEGAQRFVTAEVQSLGPNTLFIRPGSPEADRRPLWPPQTLVLEDAEAISTEVPTVVAVAPELTGNEVVSYRGRNASVTVIGTTPDYTEVRDFQVDRGRFISKLDGQRVQRVVVLGSEVARQLFNGQDPIGQSVRVRNLRAEVIGVMQPKGSSFGMDMDMTVFLPLRTMANQLVGRRSPYGTSVSYISLSARDETVMRAAQFQIENLLRRRHKIVGEDDFTVRNQQDLQNTLGAITGTLQVMLVAIASISLLVGGIGITNIMLVSVAERTQEIGLRKAIGASQRDILMQFVIEATILASLGGAIGTAVGVGGLALVSVATDLEAAPSSTAIGVAVGVSGGIGLFFGVIPAQQAAKLDPIVALRSA